MLEHRRQSLFRYLSALARPHAYARCESQGLAAGRQQSAVSKRAEESFRDVYLTLVSIIQGVALGFLVQVLSGLYQHLNVDQIGRIVAVVALIAAVWQEYMIGSTMYAWIPGVIDAVTPFALGLFQGLMITTIDAPAETFLLLTALTYVIGYVAELNYSVKALTSSLAIASESRHVISIHPRTGPVLALLAVAFSFLLWGSARIGPATISGALVWLSAGPPIIFLLSSYVRWTRPMRAMATPTNPPT